MRTSDAKLIPTTGTLKFWRPQDIVQLSFVIPIIRGEDYDQRTEWPGGNFPSWSEIKAELSASKSAYVSIKPMDGGGGHFLNFLVGRYMIQTVCKRNQSGQGTLRVNLTKSGIKFANNSMRRTMLVQGVRIEHRGIALTTFDAFFRDFTDRDSVYSSGRFATELVSLEAKQAPEVGKGKHRADEEDEPLTPLLETEENLLHTLETYVEAEYFLEEQEARAIAGFAFVEVTPEKRVASVRKYFRLRLLGSDCKRLRALAPGMLALEGAVGERLLQFRVDDLAPNGGIHQIVVSTGEQLASGAIPDTGTLVLFANPTQKNVRLQVIENLRQRLSPNRWLVPLAAQSYVHSNRPTISVPIPPAKNPPNPSQLLAINAGAGTDDYMLVLGPPGTGKTTVILRWVEFFASQGKRILISSQNNKAVDNVLERLAENRKLTCVRLGSEGTVSSSVHDLLIDNCASSLQRRLVDALERNVSLLAHFEKMCIAMEVSGNAMGHGVDGFADGLDRLQEFAFEKLGDLKGFLTHAVVGENVFSTSVLRTYHDRLTAIPLRLEQLTNELKSNSLGVEDQKTALLSKLVKDRKTEVESFGAVHQTQCEALDDRKQQLSEKSGLLKPLYSIAAWGVSRRKRALIAKHESELAAAEKRYTDKVDAVTREAVALLAQIEAEHGSVQGKLNSEYQQLLGSVETLRKVKLTQLAVVRESFVRVVHEATAWHKTISNQRQEGLYSILLNFVDVVGATCIGINTNKFFKEALFDVVIVDESGQIQLHNLSVPLSRAPKAILVGDHKQLPPVVKDELVDEVASRAEADSGDIDTKLLKKSWFELLWDSAPEDRKAMLNTQFRCPAVISDYISAAFYENKYFAGAGMAEKKPLSSFFSSPMVFIDTSKLPMHVRQESSRRGDDRDELIGNVIETRLVLDVLGRALSSSPDLGERREIGVIVPYKLHVQEIQRAISARQRAGELLGLPSPINELVASVDSYQGQERDLIVFTFTRSNPNGGVGFLADWRRLNVAMTRAKRQLVMIGDFSTLAKPSKVGRRDAEFKDAMAQLRSFVQKHGQLIDASAWLPDLAKSK